MDSVLDFQAIEKLIYLRVRGKLSKEEYRQFVPVMESMIERHGKVRLLVEMEDFQGWTAGALWEDLKFDFKHYRDIERIALIGDKKWQEWMSTFCKPFTSAEVRFYQPEERAEAKEWVLEGMKEAALQLSY